jgi:hypothetical protein
MMKVALHVDYSDGSGVDVVATAPDLLAFERHFDKPFTVFGTDMRLEYVLWLAWRSLNRQGKTSLEFDPWIETVANVGLGESEEPPPLESGQPIGS